MRRLSGWQKAGLVVGVGCSSIVAILVVGAIVAVVWARSTIAGLGDTTPTEVDRAIALPAPASAPGDPANPAGGAGSRGPLALTIDLAEGVFVIEPGPSGGEVQVRGTYSQGLYELTQRQETDGAGRARTTIGFRSKAPAWARVLSGFGGGDAGDRPRLTLRIPQGVPLDLSLHVSMGESRIDLGGLTLGELDLDVSMGEHRIDFGRPVVGELRRFRLDTSMGNVSIDNLGNAHAQTMETSSSMGNLTADLGGAWQAGEEPTLSFSQSMGELTVRVPSGVRLETDFRDADRRGDSRSVDTQQPADAKAPLVRLRVESSMGGSRVVRY